MMIGYPELVLILFAALFLFGPNKLPEMARSIGKAAGEFKKAQIEAENEFKQLAKPVDEKETKIFKLAAEMGIDTKNKTIEQLVEEIRLKIRLKEDLPPKMAGV